MKISKNDSSDLISTPFLVRGMAQCLCVSCKSIISCYFWGLVALRYYSFWKCPCHCPEYIFQKSTKLLSKNFNVKIAALDLELSCWFVQCSWWVTGCTYAVNTYQIIHNSFDSMNFNSETKNFGFPFQMSDDFFGGRPVVVTTSNKLFKSELHGSSFLFLPFFTSLNI